MNKKIIAMLVIMTLMMVISVSAQQIFKQNTIIDFKIQCIINGTYCSNLAVCNVSIQYPNASLLVQNTKMTNQYSFYNYTLNNLTSLGEYTCSSTCCDGALCGTNGCNFIVTPTGYTLDTGSSILYFIGLSFAFIIFILFLYFAIITPMRNGTNDEGKIVSINDLKYLKVFFIVMAYLTGLFTVGLVYSITNNFLYVNGISQIFSWIYWLMLSGMYPMIILWVIIAFILFLNDLTEGKKIKRRNYR